MVGLLDWIGSFVMEDRRSLFDSSLIYAEL